MRLVAKWPDEDDVGVDILIGGQNFGEFLRTYPVALEVCITEDDHKVLVRFLLHYRLNSVLCCLEGVITADTELRMSMESLRGENNFKAENVYVEIMKILWKLWSNRQEGHQVSNKLLDAI